MPKQSPSSPTIKKRFSLFRIFCFFFILIVFGILLLLLAWEIRTSRLQARFFSSIARNFSYSFENGPSRDIRFPEFGPYDVRLGYVGIPQWIDKLSTKGYAVAGQAKWSPELVKTTDLGIFTSYREKTRTGICILDRHGETLLCNHFPEREFPDFHSIPPILVKTLLFIENRHLLDTDSACQNPAVEWQRMGKALFDSAIRLVDSSRSVAGGSTLATQLEKFRHSPGGITENAKEKLRQMISSSFRAYLSGADTFQTRRQIILDYLNSIPLAAAPGFGEVLGLGDGLWAWYGMDFNAVTRALKYCEQNALSPAQTDEAGKAIKAALSLFIAQRRPSVYLLDGREDLENLTDTYLRLFTKNQLISDSIADAAIKSRLTFKKESSFLYPFETAQRKAASFIRSNLMSMLEVERLYDLDHLDLKVQATMDMELQRKATQILFQLKDPQVIRNAGLYGPHLLGKGDPAKVTYSFSLYEHTANENLLRVQANNYDGSFNIDEQMKLDMGSSAKLRVLSHYLDLIVKLHERYSRLARIKLASVSADPALDPLSRWAVDYLSADHGKELTGMLNAAMDRGYSASPAERFFTGGGMHTFANFKKEDDGRIMTVREAFRRSVNLVFIRLMRDIVYYHIHERYNVTPQYLEKIDESEKKRLLMLFADKEGITFIRGFYHKYSRKSPQGAMDLLLAGIQNAPVPLAATFRFIMPEAPVETFIDFLNQRLPGSDLKKDYVENLYGRYSADNYPLADIGYIARIHPLELWVVRFLMRHPDAPLDRVISESAKQRQAVYQWLFKTKSPRKQINRIRTIIELEAFQDIHREWKRLGYPFDALVPSYATAIGSSGDRPGALAELIGIVLNNGMFYPRIRVESLHFAENTPYETLMTVPPPKGIQVMAPQAAQIARLALLDVVETGTASRLKNAIRLPDGNMMAIGGKTGTGDHRYKTFGPGGALKSSKVMNRAAIFVFMLGERHFGTISAYVAGPEAANYDFSSSLPVQVLKMLLPELIPL
jgi:membrane peptidoglycan carboxypeptidase